MVCTVIGSPRASSAEIPVRSRESVACRCEAAWRRNPSRRCSVYPDEFCCDDLTTKVILLSRVRESAIERDKRSIRLCLLIQPHDSHERSQVSGLCFSLEGISDTPCSS